VPNSIPASGSRAAVKLVANNPAGGGITPLDGILSITLIDLTDLTNPRNFGVADAIVDYIDDP
jgi:hypothetical protein